MFRPSPSSYKNSLLLVAMLGAAACIPMRTAAAAMAPGEVVASKSDCMSCHAVDHKVVGPAFDAVAAKYAGQAGAKAMLMKAIKDGHVGTWGQIPMPPHPNLSEKQLDEAVTWILSLKPAAAKTSTAAKKTYTYTVEGKTVTLDFPVFQPGTKKVTKPVFTGYELWNSYCFRCHGADADGSEYAPDLRRSVRNGMTDAKMTEIAMTGIKAKGMPSWAGFFDPTQLTAIYQYVAARAYNLVGQGTPTE